MSGLVEYPCPLGGDRWAYLRLPSDFRDADCARVIAYLKTLALPPADVADPPASPEVHSS